jgi:hypothetical protein
MPELDGNQILRNADVQLGSIQKENIKKQINGIGYLGEYQPTSSIDLRVKATELFNTFNIEGDDSGTLGVSRPVQYIDNFPTPSGDNLSIRGQFHDTGKPYAVAYQNPDNPEEIFIVKGQTQEAAGSFGPDFGPTFVPDATPQVWSDSNPLPDEYRGFPIVAAFTDIPRKNEQPSSTTEAPAASEVTAIPYEHRQILSLVDKINNPDTTKDDLKNALHELRAQLLPNERLGPPTSSKNIFDEKPLPETSPQHPTKARNGDRITCILAEDRHTTTPLYEEYVLGVFGTNLILLQPQLVERSPSTHTPLETASDLVEHGRWEHEQISYLINLLRAPGAQPSKLLVGHIT